MVVSTLTCAESGFDSETYERDFALFDAEIEVARRCEQPLARSFAIAKRLGERREDNLNAAEAEFAILD